MEASGSRRERRERMGLEEAGGDRSPSHSARAPMLMLPDCVPVYGRSQDGRLEGEIAR